MSDVLIAVLQGAGTLVAAAGSAVHLVHFRARYAGAYEGLRTEVGLGSAADVREAVIDVMEAEVARFEDVETPSLGQLALPPDEIRKRRRNHIADYERRHELSDRLRQLYVADHALDQTRRWERVGDRCSWYAFLMLFGFVLAGVALLVREAPHVSWAWAWVLGMFLVVACTVLGQLYVCGRLDTERDRAREAASGGRKGQ